MIFGVPAQFAVEVVLEPGPEFAVIQGNNIAGRIGVWLCGRRVGRINEPSCWLGPPCLALAELAQRLDDLWDTSFSELEFEQIFDRLDYLNFVAHRHRTLDDDWDAETWARVEAESVGFERFNFLLNTSEAFDGWKAFLVRPTNTTTVALVLANDSPDVEVLEFPTECFLRAIDECTHWYLAQERRLLPDLPGSFPTTHSGRRPTTA